MEQIVIEIANVTVAINSENKKFIDKLKDRYANFLSLRNAEKEILMKTITPDIPSNNYTRDNPYYKIIVTPDTKGGCHISSEEMDWIIYPDIDQIELTLEEDIYSFDSFLRILYSYLLIEREGFLLHAASIMDDKNRCYVFFGPSEAGKSTLVSISQGKEIISDEIVAIRIIRGSIVAFSTPFWGKWKKGKTNANAPVECFFKIIKDEKIYFEKIRKIDVLFALLTNVIFLYQISNISEKVLNILEKLTRKSFFYMHFTPTKYFWSELKKLDLSKFSK